jgi:hypothetical protein
VPKATVFVINGCSTTPPFHPRPLARGVALRAQLGAHLARQARDGSQPEDVRRIALIRTAKGVAVPAHEGVSGFVCRRRRARLSSGS